MNPYYQDDWATIYLGNSLSILKELPDESVQCCITSPPYWNLRDYGVEGQIGIELKMEEYIDKMVIVFKEIKRILRNDGTLWLNIGDSYAVSGLAGKNPDYIKKHKQFGKKMYQKALGMPRYKPPSGLKPKDLCGIPWRLAFALQSDGWYLRSDIIWHKPNPMPESVEDRPTKSHEYIFLMSKSPKYYYDAYSIAEDYKEKTLTTFNKESKGRVDGSGLIKSENWHNDLPIKKPKEWKIPTDGRRKNKYNQSGLNNHSGYYNSNGELIDSGKANKRDVWTVPTKPYKEAHFATFPENLIKPCILAGTSMGDVIIDPFIGAGTTAYVAKEFNRKSIGIDINEQYIKLTINRLIQEVLDLKTSN